MALDIVVMAAGKGTRMKSARPKVLHRLAGRALLQHVLDAVASLSADRVIVVTGHGADAVEASLDRQDIVFVRQPEQRGTGHAVQQAVPALHDAGTTLILTGDSPLVRTESLRQLVAGCDSTRLALMTVVLDDPTGYGRILRDDAGQVHAIVEQRDATPEQLLLREGYSGAMAAPTAWLRQALARLEPHNAQRELLLTDLVALAVADRMPVVASVATHPEEALGINSPAQLADLERRFQQRVADRLMDAGVRLADPARLDVRGELVCGQDVEIDVNCVFEGRVVLGDGVRIGPHCVVRDAEIGAGALLQAFTHVNGDGQPVVIGARAEIGPFARLRPGAALGDEVHIGNFVEVKNSTLARGAKANHLAYLGDATVGERVNYGAGSITANYDGAHKHRTVIEADAHIGSNCVLVAPVTIGAGATIGGGSTISKPAPAGQLTVARAKQVSIAGWQRPKKEKR
jgi:bifunctional UDP-N-acetylglucosamine pyrophosphorylase / glucosamine-1-phosphate N-acetyltransferase